MAATTARIVNTAGLPGTNRQVVSGSAKTPSPAHSGPTRPATTRPTSRRRSAAEPGTTQLRGDLTRRWLRGVGGPGQRPNIGRQAASPSTLVTGRVCRVHVSRVSRTLTPKRRRARRSPERAGSSRAAARKGPLWTVGMIWWRQQNARSTVKLTSRCGVRRQGLEPRTRWLRVDTLTCQPVKNSASTCHPATSATLYRVRSCRLRLDSASPLGRVSGSRVSTCAGSSISGASLVVSLE